MKQPELFINPLSEFRHKLYQRAFAPLLHTTFLPWQLQINIIDQHMHLTKFIAYTNRFSKGKKYPVLPYHYPNRLSKGKKYPVLPCHYPHNK